MTMPFLFALAGVALFVTALHAVVVRRHLLIKIMALNVMGSGVFLITGALGRRGEVADPVPDALVITGIVVAVAATAFAIALMLRVVAATGSPELPAGERG